MRILIAEDELVSRRLLAGALKKMGHDVVQTSNGRDAWDVLRREDIRLVVADWEMPEMTGLDLVRRIRTETPDRYVYMILLTSRGLKQDIIKGLEAGADDYITKPFDSDELRFRIKAGERVANLELQLAQRNDELRRMALVDGLTGIRNRRAFDEVFAQRREQARRFRRYLSVLMIDIDRFKNYNDSLGHEAGDDALRQVASILSGELRQADDVYRYGGEEFVCVLEQTAATGAAVVAERLRRAVQQRGLVHPGNPPLSLVTISVGLATFDPERSFSADDLLHQADQALYAAKSAGRNRVVQWAGASVTPALTPSS